MSSWFESFGWWDQQKAYEAFDAYRKNPTEENREQAILACLSVIRVVYSAQRIWQYSSADQEDLIASAALTITAALPKMREKTEEQIGNDMQLMRYLFSCVINAFRREIRILHSKQKKIREKIIEQHESQEVENKVIDNVENSMVIENLRSAIVSEALHQSRIRSGPESRVLAYFIRSLVDDREVSPRILSIVGLSKSDVSFLKSYASYLVRASLLRLKKTLFGAL